MKALLDLVIGDGCRQQGLPFDQDQCGADSAPGSSLTMSISSAGTTLVNRLLQLPPLPRRMDPLLRVVPRRWQHALIQRAMSHVLPAALSNGSVFGQHGRPWLTHQGLALLHARDPATQPVLDQHEQRMVIVDIEWGAGDEGCVPLSAQLQPRKIVRLDPATTPFDPSPQSSQLRFDLDQRQ